MGLVGGDGWGVEVALDVGASELGEGVGLFGVFDAFGDGFEFEGLGELEDGFDDPFAFVVAGEVVDEAFVDFEDVDGEFREGGEGGVAGAEVVDRDADPGAAEVVEGVDDAAGFTGEDGFGDFEDEAVGVEVGAGERVGDVFGEVGVGELQA